MSRLGRGLYAGLLRAMPRAFRARHAGEIERALHERAGSPPGLRFWMAAIADLLWGLAVEWGGRLRRVSLAAALRDARFAARSLRRTPALTLLSVGALALGMGANTAVFSLVNEILLRPLPVREPERLVDLHVEQPGANSFTGFSYPEYQEYRRGAGPLVGVSATRGIGLRLGEAGQETGVSGQLTSAGYFEVIGIEAARGRLFSATEMETAGAVAVVSHGFWQRRLGGAGDAVGSIVRFNGVPFTVVGVMPEGFSGQFIGFPVEVWIPITLMPRLVPGVDLLSWQDQGLEMLGRLRAGETVAAAEAALGATAVELESRFPNAFRLRRVRVTPTTGIDDSLHRGVVGFVSVLLALSALVLATACLNVGGMLLARGSYRRREMALRAAIGASRSRLVGQVIVEALTLFAAGTAMALLVTLQFNALARRLVESAPLPLGFDLGIDARVLGFTLIVGLATALLTALSPAIRAARGAPAEALRTGAGQSAASHRLRNAFLVGQVALSVVLLATAALFVRAARSGARIDSGFDVAALAASTIGLPADRYTEGAAAEMFEGLAERLAGSPLIDSVTFAQLPPVDVVRARATATIPGLVDESGDASRAVDANAVGGGYFDVVGIPLLEGRGFVDADQAPGRRVAVINHAAAAAFWREREPVGRTLLLDGEEHEVVGVVADTRAVVQDAAPAPLVYVAFGQRPGRRATLVMRSRAAAGALTSLVRSELGALDAALTPPSVQPMSDIIELTTMPQRLAARFAGVLGALSLLLAASGVYGIVSYAVGCRRRELGIRVALGGAPGSQVLLVMRSGLRLVVLGLLAGALGMFLVAPLLREFLLEISPFDPVAVGTACGLILSVAAVAAYVPARRASRIDPAISLRAE